MSKSEYLSNLVVRAGMPTQLSAFGGEDADRIDRVDRLAEGGWTIESHRRGSRAEKFLRNSQPVGWSSGDGDPPFGRWERVPGGWLGEAIRRSPDPGGQLEASMLRTYLPEQGEPEQVLWEVFRDGGGVVYRLKGPLDGSAAPEVADVYAYVPGEEPRPPFFHYAHPTPPTPGLEELFTRGNRASFRREPVGEHFPAGGWSVRYNSRKFKGELHLRDQHPPTYEHSGSLDEDPMFRCWTRIEGGWLNVAQAEFSPEMFGRFSGSRLLTTLTDSGEVRMELRVDRLGGGGQVYQLRVDGLEHGGIPDVIGVQEFSATAGGMAPGGIPQMAGRIVDEGESVVIGAVRLQKRRS